MITANFVLSFMNLKTITCVERNFKTITTPVTIYFALHLKALQFFFTCAHCLTFKVHLLWDLFMSASDYMRKFQVISN